MLMGSKTKADVKVCERNTQKWEIRMKKLAGHTHGKEHVIPDYL